MSISVQKLWNQYGVGGVMLFALILFGFFYLYKILFKKEGYEYNQSMPSQYSGQNQGNHMSNSQNIGNVPSPSDPLGHNETYESAGGLVTSSPGLPMQSHSNTIQNPSELLPKDTNSQWAQLNPVGSGELANVQLLRANLQIRSEPPNPQLNVGPWNQSTITGDFMRPPLEIGSGAQ